MKSKAKKLALHRETLAELDRSQMAPAAGGYTSYLCPSFTCYPGVCAWSDRDTCYTCEQTCTTNYC